MRITLRTMDRGKCGVDARFESRAQTDLAGFPQTTGTDQRDAHIAEAEAIASMFAIIYSQMYQGLLVLNPADIAIGRDSGQ